MPTITRRAQIRQASSLKSARYGGVNYNVQYVPPPRVRYNPSPPRVQYNPPPREYAYEAAPKERLMASAS